MKKSNFNALETMAANMNEHETSSGVIGFEDINFSQPTTENNSANESFSEDEEEETNIYDSQRNILDLQPNSRKVLSKVPLIKQCKKRVIMGNILQFKQHQLEQIN